MDLTPTVFFLSTLALVACGGGSDGPSPFTPPVGSTDTWERGVFPPSANFKSSCAAPRNGTDPATGQAYPDRLGSATDEMFYLRSFSDNTYLWYSEITDTNPTLYSDVGAFFDQLKTNRTDGNGESIDRFHFSYDSQEWYELSQTGVSAGYGALFVFDSPTPPRNVRIGFVEAGSPAAGAALSRGSIVLTVDGVSIDSNTQAGIDTLNAALFPSTSGETHTFRIEDGQTGIRRNVSMRTETVSIDPVPLTRVFTLSNSVRVGYMLFNDHIATAELALVNAVEELNSGAGIDELVLDLRYNGGGYLAIASELAYMIAGTNATTNQTFEELQFNDKHTSTNPITGRALSPTPFYANALGPPFNAPVGMPLPTLDLNRVVILTGSNTCSASEAIINGLRGINLTVRLVGSRTCGKPFGFYPEENCGTTYFTVQFQGVNAQGFGNYPNGFMPSNASDNVGVRVAGCAVADDFSHELGDADEARLAAALELLEGRPCPVATNNGLQKNNEHERPLHDGYAVKPLALQNRIAQP